MHFCGTILEGERVIAPEVEGEYRVSTRRSGAQFWEGKVLVPPDSPIHDGGTYTLRLANGTEGEIHVGGGPYTDAGRKNSFAFRGNPRPPSVKHG
jgi:hypothetical protein